MSIHFLGFEIRFVKLFCDSLSGFAHMASAIGKEKSPEFGSSSLGGVFKVDWIKK